MKKNSHLFFRLTQKKQRQATHTDKHIHTGSENKLVEIYSRASSGIVFCVFARQKKNQLIILI